MPGCHYKPGARLAPFIHCLWYWEDAPGPHRQERLLPSAEAAMIFNLRDDPIAVYEDDGRVRRYGHAVLSGVRSNCFTIDCDQQDRVIGVQFRPGGASPFFPMPVSVMENTSLALADVWGHEAAWMRERILAGPTPQAMLRTLADGLLERLHTLERLHAPAQRRTALLHPAVIYMASQLEGSSSPGRVAAVTAQIGMSQRRLTQLFHEQVGVSPKTFHRVRRFQQTLHRLKGRSSVDWADLAVVSGYYDQAHLSHDFRRLSGMTPNAYLTAATEHLNHVPLQD